MSSIAYLYTKALYKQFNYFGTWLPNNSIKLGDIGIFDNFIFNYQSNLTELGIHFEEKEDPSFGDIDFSTKGAIEINKKGKGEIPPLGSGLSTTEAGLIINFTKKDAILFKAQGSQTLKIKDQISLATDIEALYEKGDWDKNWVIITEIIKAKSTTVLVSNEKGAQLDLNAKTDVSFGKVDIANVDLGLDVKFSKSMGAQFLASQGMRPLFKAMMIKKAWFKKKGKLQSKGEEVEKEERESLGSMLPEDL